MNNVAVLSELLKEEIMKTKPKSKKTAGEDRSRLQITITVPGLYSALEKQAAAEMRTPTAQALWILKKALME